MKNTRVATILVVLLALIIPMASTTITGQDEPPAFPYAVYGYIYEAGANNTTSVVVGATVTLTYLPTGGYTQGTTDSTGAYYLVLNKITQDFKSGDQLEVAAYKGDVYGETIVTVDTVDYENVVSITMTEESLVEEEVPEKPAETETWWVQPLFAVGIIAVIAIAAIVTFKKRKK